MKNIYSLLIITLILTSCGQDKEQSIEDVISTNNLETIRLKRTEIVAQQQVISEQLKQLDTKIAVLDTTKKIPLITTFTAKLCVFAF